MTALQEAEKHMSLYCRLRDALKWNRKFPIDISVEDPKKLVVKCCTCIRVGNWFYTMQGGHFIPKGSRGESGVRFDERNVHAQCPDCNGFHQGRTLEYLDYMLEEYGQEVIDELRREDIALKHKRGQLELLATASIYRDLYNDLIEKNFV